MSNVFKNGGWVWLSKDWERDIDLCPHDRKTEPIRQVENITVHRCLRNGCLGFHSPHRTSLEKFINFIRSLPKLPQVPVKGYVAPHEIARTLNEDERTVMKYFQVIEGFETDGVLSYIEADSKMFIYRDDPQPNATPIVLGPLSFAAIGGGVTSMVSKGDPFLTGLVTFISGLVGYGVEAYWRGLSQNMQQQNHAIDIQPEPPEVLYVNTSGGIRLLRY
jgi:hypothetical protein